MKKTSLLLILALAGCGMTREAAVPGENPGLKVVLADTRVTPDGQGLVDVGITFEGLSSCSSLVVTQKGGLVDKDKKYGIGVLSEEFTFQYAVLPDDPKEMTFSFQLNGRDGRPGPVSVLVVDNSAGKTLTPLTFSDFKVVSRVTGKEDNGHDGLPKVAYEVHNDTHTYTDNSNIYG